MPRLPSKPYWSTTDGSTVRLYAGDVIDALRGLPSESVHCVVTSPPYWGLRRYLREGSVVIDSNLPSEVRRAVLEELEELGIKPL